MSNERSALRARRVPEPKGRTVPAIYQENAFHARAGWRQVCRKRWICLLQLFPACDLYKFSFDAGFQTLARLLANFNSRRQGDAFVPGSLEDGLRQRMPRVLLDTRRHSNGLRDRYLRSALNINQCRFAVCKRAGLIKDHRAAS